jgi:type II secretory pathway component GspD/PulD (secretin)
MVKVMIVIRWVVVLLLVFSSGVFAAGNIDIRLRDVSLHDFALVVFTDVNRRSFVFDDDFIKSRELVTVNLFSASPDDVVNHLEYVLSSRDYRMVESDGVYYVTKIKDFVDRDIFVYRPRYRSADYLIELAGTVFDKRGFSSVRFVDNREGYDVETKGNDRSVNDLISRRGIDSIVYQGSYRDIQRLKKLFGDIDCSAGEVMVKAVVYEVRTDSVDSNAVSLAAGLIKSINGLGVSIANVVDASNSFRINSSNFQAVWSALSGDSRFKLVSAPVLRIRSGEQAKFTVGQDVPTLGAVSYDDGRAVQRIDYRSSGVILELLPEIHEDVIDLRVMQQISSFISTENGVNSSPTLLKRELKTSVSVVDDEVIVLGGLDEVSNKDNVSGFSFFPSFLKGSKKEDNKTEIMLLLHVQKI